MRKKYIPLTLLYFNIIIAQTNNNYDLPKIVPPSQETFNLSKVSFSASDTGDFTYQFPFSEVSGVPVKLSYTSGIKVDDIGGNVGMSWQLNAGGVISRVVRDETDENASTIWFPESVNESQDYAMIRASAHPDNSVDTEYDWFNFSVSNGFSGSFYIDKNLNVYNHDSEKSKIEIIDKNIQIPGYGKTLEFIITDKQGNQYFFGGSLNFIEKTEFEKEGPDQMAVTGWYLSKVIFANSKKVEFEYDIGNLNYLASYNSSITLVQQCSVNNHQNEMNYDFSGPIITTMTMKSEKPVLKSIFDDKVKVSFLYEKLRQDDYGNSKSPKLLTKVNVLDKSGLNSIQEFILQYDDYQNFHTYSSQNMSPHNDLTTTYRYFLNSVKEVKSNQVYQFEYIDPGAFPPRFSLKKDSYGYYNGKNNFSAFSKVTLENNIGELYILANRYFPGTATADKSIDPNYSKIGNLKKIKYPTGGYTEIGYSPNIQTTHGTKEIYEQIHAELIAKRENCTGTKDGTSIELRFPSNGEPISYYAPAPILDTEVCNSEFDSLHDQHTIKIQNLTTGETITDTQKANNIIRTFREGVDISPVTCLNYNNNVKPYCPIPTIADHWYKVTYTVTSALSKIEGQASIAYNGVYRTVPAIFTQNLPGNPVEYVTDVNNEDEKYTKKYYYTTLDKINTGNIIKENAAVKVGYEKIKIQKRCESDPQYFYRDYTMYRLVNDHVSLSFGNRQSRMYYPIITEVVDGKMATEKSYTYSSDLQPNHIKLPPVSGLPTNNFGEVRRSLLKKVTDYEFLGSSLEKIKTIDNNYSYDTQDLVNYVFRQNFSIPPGATNEDDIRNISYSEYYDYYGFSRLDNSTTTDYANGTPLETKTEYFYNNPSHYQLTTQKTTFPDLSTQTTEYQYAHEKGNTYLTGKNMVGLPLQTITYESDILKPINKTETIYPTSQTDADNKTSGLPLPVSVSTLDLKTNSMNTQVVYNQYDTKGNIQQYTLNPDANGNGTHVTIIWGYNQTQPIAKIEGATYAQVSSLATAIINASNEDANDIEHGNPKEKDLLTALDAFRTDSALAGYQITTYSYDPLIGVRSITPPSGIRELYIYDTANRLKEVRDINGVLLKENEYHYKP